MRTVVQTLRNERPRSAQQLSHPISPGRTAPSERRRRALRAASLLPVSLFSGCFSLGAHLGHPGGVYCGTRMHATVLSSEWNGENPKKTPGTNDLLIAVPFVLIDLPLSFALDTVLLPLDVIEGVRRSGELISGGNKEEIVLTPTAKERLKLSK